MGLISKVITLLFSFLLFISLILEALSFKVYSSLEYNEVERNAAPFVENFLRESLKESPSTTDRILDSVLNMGWVQKIPFTDTLKQALTEKLKSKEIDNVSLQQETQEFIQEMYYAEYDCGYWNCFSASEVPFFLISQKSQNYWYRNFKYLGIASLVLMAILFLLVSKKRNFFVLLGILSLLSSLPFWGIKKIVAVFFNAQILEFANILLSKSGYVAKLLTAWGVILIALAIIFGLFGLGFKIFNWIDSIGVKLSKPKKKPLPEKVTPLSPQSSQSTQLIKPENSKTQEIKKSRKQSKK